MNDSDVPEFKRILTKLAAVYQRTVDTDLIDSYFLALKTFSIPSIRRACQSAVDECQFFPKPVELRSYAQEPERFYDEGERTFACLKCYDRGVIVTDRYGSDGRAIGTYAAPCACQAGEAKRAAWEKPDAHGHAFADVAKANTVKLRKLGAL